MTLEPPASKLARLILYVGKGGVGKTTIAAATAVRAAELGYRTLVVSTDIAHSLGDVLLAPLGNEPTQISERLWACEVNVLEEAKRTWGGLQERLAEALREQGLAEIQADELAIIPGMEEVAALVQLRRFRSSGQFDCIIVDAAPTGETLRLLSMPDAFLWYVNRFNQLRTGAFRLLGPLLRSILPAIDLAETLSRVAEETKQLRAELTDSDTCSYRIVMTPDSMVIKEARRAETYLNLFEYPIDAVCVNRIVDPDTGTHPLLKALTERQQTAILEIRQTFSSLPQLEAPLSADEPLGVAKLSALAATVFARYDPVAVLHRGATLRIERQGEGYLLTIPLPNVETQKLSLTKHGDELHVEVGNFRRGITLPLSLTNFEPGRARIRSGNLEIQFMPAEPAPSPVPGVS
ncbi:MAG: ArsA family ATPase [Chloroflexi bacterium]|nr:ArsA family ATPase [Chloroflexota bacterium]MCL4543709.1 ArsA family ATPase [Chloroflexota bacterium]